MLVKVNPDLKGVNCLITWIVQILQDCCLEGDIGVCGIAVLDNFSSGISVILLSKCGIAVFSEPVGCGFSAFWMVLKITLYPPSPPTFSEPFPVSDWTFPMKLSSHGNGKLQIVKGYVTFC